MKQMIVSVAMVLVGGAAVAAGPKPEGYDDYQTASDAAGTVTSYNGPGNWTVLKAAPEPGKRYCVHGATMYTPSASASQTEYVFQGDELCIASGVLWPLTTASRTLDVHIVVSNLVLRNSGAITYGAKRPGIYGRCTILDTSDTAGNRARLSGGMAIKRRQWVTDHYFDLVGDKDQCLLAEFTAADKETQSGDYAITGAQTNYFGMYRIGNGASLCLIGDVPGNVVVESNALYRTWFHHGSGGDSYREYDVFQDAQTISNMTLATGAELEISASNVLTVVNLTLKGGSTIRLDSTATTNGVLVVSGALTLTDPERGKIRLICSHDWSADAGKPPAYPTVVLGKDAAVFGGAFDADLFEFVDEGTMTTSCGLPKVYREMRAAEDGTQTLVSTCREVAILQLSENYEAKYVSPLVSATNAEGQAYWSTGKAPQAGLDYFVDNKDINFYMDSAMVPFEGDSLTLRNARIYSGNKTGCAGASFKQLNFYSGSGINNWAGRIEPGTYDVRRMTVAAESLFLDGSVEFLDYGDCLLRIAAPLCGSGDLLLTTYNYTGNAKDGRSKFELEGDNTAWTGKLKISVATYSKPRNETGAEAEYWGCIVPSNRVFITLFLNDGKSLGGPLPTLTRDAVTVEQYSMLCVTNNDVTFEQENRGILVNTIGQFSVAPAKTLAIKAPLTLTGELWKHGDGVLALGGELAFAGGAAVAAAGSTNIVRVKGGALKALAKDAFNGADIRIEGEGAGFRFDVAPANAELATYGVCNVKARGAVDGEAVAVAFDGVSDQSAVAAGTKIGLFTLATEAAATALQAKLSVASPRKNRVSTVVEQTALGYTVSAVFEQKPGMLMFFR